MDCKHELQHLVGMADGIHCTACGAVLQMLPVAEAKAQKKAAPKAAPKKTAPKKGGKNA